MSRRAKGPRLWLYERPGREAVWVILDGRRQVSTGCGAGDRAQAETALAEYLARTRLASVRNGDPGSVTIADVLTFYAEHRAPSLACPELVGYHMMPLIDHAGTSRCDAINGRWCRDYVAKRASGKIGRAVQEATARRELEHLSAALGYAVKEGLLAYRPALTFPKVARPRERFLTRDEVARLLWVCWRTRALQDRGGADRWPLRHVARFILVGVYTGTRSGAICTASFRQGPGRSWVDTKAGIFHRLAEGRAETNKRQPPVAVPDRLLAHLRRWEARGDEWVVSWKGEPVEKVKKSFARAVALAGLDGRVTPHVLRHTFVSWKLQSGLGLWAAAKLAGMSVKTAERTYGHYDAGMRDDANAGFRWRAG